MVFGAIGGREVDVGEVTPSRDERAAVLDSCGRVADGLGSAVESVIVDGGGLTKLTAFTAALSSPAGRILT